MWQIWLAAFTGEGSDFSGIFTTVTKTIGAAPTKSFISLYTTSTGTAEQDTGITLSVPDGHSYVITFQLFNQIVGNTATARLYEGAVLKQSFSNAYAGGPATANDEYSFVYTNVTGSPQTVKLTIQNSASGTTARIKQGCLIEGLYVLPSSIPLPSWLQVTQVDWQYSGQAANVAGIGKLIQQQTDANTTAISDTLPTTEFYTQFPPFSSLVGTPFFVAFDWAGKYVTLV